ncbi:MAG: NRDE family protein, partial [Acidimicrobiales bacterium]
FKPVDYNPAWLLVGDRTSLFSVDMTGEAGPPVAQELPPGVHILENLPLGSDSPKVDHVRRLLGDVSHTGGDEVLLQRLSVVLADHSLPAGVSAQDAEHTDDEEGREPEQDRKRPTATLAACVHTETYGTRSSTLVSVRSDELSQISLRVADGPPCTAEFVDKTRLWEPVAS